MNDVRREFNCEIIVWFAKSSADVNVRSEPKNHKENLGLSEVVNGSTNIAELSVTAQKNHKRLFDMSAPIAIVRHIRAGQASFARFSDFIYTICLF